MVPQSIRATRDIHRDCACKLRSIEKSATFTAILASLLDEDWTTPNIEELRISCDGHLVARTSGQASFKAFRGAKEELIRNIHKVAAVVGLDGDEVGYLLGKVAKIKAMG